MIRDLNDDSIQRNILLRIVFQPTVSLAALLLLAIPAPLQAQSNERGFSHDARCFQRADLQSLLKTTATNPTRGGEAGRISSAPGDSALVATQSNAAELEYSLVTSAERCSTTTRSTWFSSFVRCPCSVARSPKANYSDRPARETVVLNPRPPDFNDGVYYKNRLEFSLDGGWLPINIPFVFDVFLGDAYTMTDLKYTLVPIIASLRWQMNDVGGPWTFRGNWDLTASAAITVIPRGPETRYFAWIMGIRRNFVPRHGRIAPYFDGRLGLGRIDAKAPLGVLYAQGQNFTFTMNMGSGVRYNFNPRYSISAGMNWMHISNLYLSQPKFANYGINVYGPMFGIDLRLGGPHQQASE